MPLAHFLTERLRKMAACVWGISLSARRAGLGRAWVLSVDLLMLTDCFPGIIYLSLEGLTVKDVDIFEINEAFASQVSHPVDSTALPCPLFSARGHSFFSRSSQSRYWEFLVSEMMLG